MSVRFFPACSSRESGTMVKSQEQNQTQNPLGVSNWQITKIQSPTDCHTIPSAIPCAHLTPLLMSYGRNARDPPPPPTHTHTHTQTPTHKHAHMHTHTRTHTHTHPHTHTHKHTNTHTHIRTHAYHTHTHPSLRLQLLKCGRERERERERPLTMTVDRDSQCFRERRLRSVLSASSPTNRG